MTWKIVHRENTGPNRRKFGVFNPDGNMVHDVIEVETIPIGMSVIPVRITRESIDEDTGLETVRQEILTDYEHEYVEKDYLFPGEEPYVEPVKEKHAVEVSIKTMTKRKEMTVEVVAGSEIEAIEDMMERVQAGPKWYEWGE